MVSYTQLLALMLSERKLDKYGIKCPYFIMCSNLIKKREYEEYCKGNPTECWYFPQSDVRDPIDWLILEVVKYG